MTSRQIRSSSESSSRNSERGDAKIFLYLGIFTVLWFVGGYLYGCLQKEKLRRMGITEDGEQKGYESEYQGPPKTHVEVPL